MKNYIKPSANVIEIAVKERLSRTSVRTRNYDIKVGNNTKINRDIDTNIYTSRGVSNIEWKKTES